MSWLKVLRLVVTVLDTVVSEIETILGGGSSGTAGSTTAK